MFLSQSSLPGLRRTMARRAVALLPALAMTFAVMLAPVAAPMPASAHSYTLGTLSIGHPWSRETAAGQSAGGGFLTITNRGTSADRLTGGETAVATRVEIHTMSMDGGVMRMRPLRDGLTVRPGETVALQPGSVHIMLTGLKRPLRQGEMVPVTLHFARGGMVEVQFKVEAITYGGPSHGGH